MNTNQAAGVTGLRQRLSPLGLAGVVALVGLSAAGVTMGAEKVFVISWVAFAAMASAALVGERAGATTDAGRLATDDIADYREQLEKQQQDLDEAYRNFKQHKEHKAAIAASRKREQYYRYTIAATIVLVLILLVTLWI